jgi:acyl-CoA synthetase (AMP-forming)/AMP-acid ligase II
MIETFVEALARHAREQPLRLALADDRVRLKWREVAEWVESAAGGLAAQAGSRRAAVLGWLPNAPEWYLLRWACERAGLLWVPVSANQGVREITFIISRVRPALLVTCAHFRQRDYVREADGACREAGLDVTRIVVPEHSLLRLDGPRSDATSATRLPEEAHLLATTGSEGTPKLCAYTLEAAAERGHAQAKLLKMTRDDIVVALSAGTGPGKTPWLAAPLVGATIVATPIFRPEQALELAEAERATMVCGTPAQLVMMLPHLGLFDLSSVRVWYTAGSVLPAGLADELEGRTKGVVLSVYGATDFGGWASPDLDDTAAVRHRTVGRPLGGTEFRIVDPAGHEVPRGHAGEILGRGRCCVSGYYGDPDLTQERWRDGWFRTGDIGRLDEEGNLVILGRTRDLIIRGGENITPMEIETLLGTHPAVAQLAVVAVPDSLLGERVCACVVPAPGPPPTLEMLREHLRAQGVAHYKLPERLIILSTLPMVGDKIDRLGLAARAAAEASVTLENGQRDATSFDNCVSGRSLDS